MLGISRAMREAALEPFADPRRTSLAEDVEMQEILYKRILEAGKKLERFAKLGYDPENPEARPLATPQQRVFTDGRLVLRIAAFTRAAPPPRPGARLRDLDGAAPVTLPRFPCLGFDVPLFTGRSKGHPVREDFAPLFLENAHAVHLRAAVEVRVRRFARARDRPTFVQAARRALRNAPRDVAASPGLISDALAAELQQLAVDCAGLECPEVGGWLRSVLRLRAVALEVRARARARRGGDPALGA